LLEDGSARFMIPARYRWQLRLMDEEQAHDWSSRLGIPLLVARVLAVRGFSEAEAAALFQPATEDGLEDPMRLKGMPEAVKRIRQAIASGEKIRVYGDYDADGVTSTALMSKLLTKLGANYDTYIPHRSLEGYGLNLKAVEAAADAGVTLIVTVDNGISAAEQIAYARKLGIDVVVTDHHEPPPDLPEAAALVNPKQPGCEYPNKGLCGAGVAFKLAHALLGRPAAEWSDLAAIGTIADLMPLVGENRLIVRMGLSYIRKEPAVGIRALAAVCKLDPADLTSGRIGFALGPRLNAGGRLDRADGAVRLLTTDDAAEAERMAMELDRLNAQRQRMVEETIEEAEQLWQSKRQAESKVIVLSKAGWHAGIAGLVASKLVERYHLPAIVLAEDPASGTAKGSARSIDGFDLHAALSDCAELMVHFGGHQAAAGMTIRTELVAELEQRLQQWAEERLEPEDWLPMKHADLLCSVGDLTLDAAESLGRLEPFGNGHKAPRFMIEGAEIRECLILGREGKHIRLTVSQSGRMLEAVGFGMSGWADRLTAGMKLDLLGELAVNEWNGRRRVQFTVQDLKSDEWRWIDRREAADQQAKQELEQLAAANGAGLVLLCASRRLAEELSHLAASYGVSVCVYTNMQGVDAEASRETAASADGAAPLTGSSMRKLAIYGLPDNAEDIRLLAERMLNGMQMGACWSSISLFRGRATSREKPPMLSRDDCARLYKLFREQGEWQQGDERFAARMSERTGLQADAVRLAEAIFTELGFIGEQGERRMVEPAAARRKLEESRRYRLAQRDAEAAAFPDWPLERLKSWGERIRRNGPEQLPESEA